MFGPLTRILKTIAGKALLGLAVAITAVSTAAASGAQLPVVGGGGSDDGPDIGDPGIDIDQQSSEAGNSGEGEDEDDDADNHGAVVSGFAESTELEGCERGQAVAGVARGDLDPEADSFDDDVTELVEERCDHPGDGDDGDEGEGSGRPDHVPGPPEWVPAGRGGR